MNRPLTRYQIMDQVSERIKRLRERFIQTVPEISSQRALIVTESYNDTMAFPFTLRRATAFVRLLREMDIYIADDELVVGSLAEMPRGVPLFPEYAVDFLLAELHTFETRVADRFLISEENKALLRAVLPRWRGQCLNDYAQRLFPEEAKEAVASFSCLLTALRSGVGHMIVDYDYWLQKGIGGVMDDIRAAAANADSFDPDYSRRREFYEAALMVVESMRDFILRYERLAQEEARRCAVPCRREELEEIARVCGKVAAHKPESFHEACQLFFFLHVALQLESNGHSVSLGRFDQYMHPFFQADLRRDPGGTAAVEELIHCLWIKLCEINKVRDKLNSIAFGGYPMFQHVTLGGQNRDGKSAVNELSRICLDATARVGLFQPSSSIRWFYGIEDEFMEKAVRVASCGTGMPAFFNDEVLLPNMLQMGFDLFQARNYAIIGCTEMTVPGISEPWLTGGFINLAKMLEYTIFDGLDLVTGEQRRFRTGQAESHPDFESFLDAYKKQTRHYLGQLVTCDNILDVAHGRMAPTVLEAVVTRGCLQAGKTTLEGGALFNSTTINAVGIANVADSLAAIRQAVYEEKVLTWQELKAALKDNFEGHEQIRGYLRYKAPKYGTDTAAVDELGNEVLSDLHECIAGFSNPRGGPYRIALYSISTNVMVADRVGATPDGRKQGENLADGGVSASHGMDKEGPTALLNSVVRLDPYKALGSTLLNLKLHPGVFENPRNVGKVSSLFQTYFMRKGQHVQLNVIDAETLRDAQNHPEKHPFLTVRVAGFSVLFTAIDPRTQEEIIARTEHHG